MRMIRTDQAPAPKGHYSQAVVHGGLVYVAGQLGTDPAAPGRPVGSAREQAEQAMRNVAAILEAAGSGVDRLLQLTVYVSDMELWGEVDAVLTAQLGEHRPARAIVPVKEFRDGLRVEIQAIAAADDGDLSDRSEKAPPAG
jgi:2-iminobutanoate/2-iminopropanoate deaminase